MASFFPPSNRTVHYCLTNNKHFSFPANSLPEQLRNQKQIVELMANYMEQNLMEVWKLQFSWQAFISWSVWFVSQDESGFITCLKRHLQRLFNLPSCELNETFSILLRVEICIVRSMSQVLLLCSSSGWRLTMLLSCSSIMALYRLGDTHKILHLLSLINS